MRCLVLGALLFAITANSEIRVIDDQGAAVVLEKPAQSIIGLSPHIVENIFAAGAGDLLVGSAENADYPEQAISIPVVASFASLNREALLLAKADLVVAWGSGNGNKIISQVRELGIPVYVDEPQSLSDIAKSLQAIGLLTGRKKQAERAAQTYLHQLTELKEQYSTQSRLSVLYQIWHSPIQTVNGDHLISDVMVVCGGVNAFADAKPVAPVLNRESILARDPDVIIGSGENSNRPGWLDEWWQWPSLSAVKNEHVYFIPPDFLQRHTPRVLIGMEMMCEQLSNVREDLGY